MQPMIAIDPGAGGGIAWCDEAGIVSAVAMPEGMTGQVDFLRMLHLELADSRCVMEKCGTWFPGDHPTSACKFARHVGHLQAALYAIGFSCAEVAPGVWQKSMGALPKDKGDRKRAIREAMQRRYPHLRVTLATADALAILTHERGRK